MKRSALLTLALLLVAPAAEAQQRGPGAPSGPTQTAPVRNKPVGPQRGGPGDDEPQGPSPSSRPQVASEPSIKQADDPLALPEGVSERIGTDYDGKPPSPEGKVETSYFPLFTERKGDYRLRLVPPLYLEHTRGLDTTTGERTTQTDTESLTGLLFYQRRSPTKDRDVLFPLMWRWREDQNHVFVLGPIAHREAPHEHDNWLAPAFFQGRRKDGGYFHSPLLLTTTHWGEKGAFTLVGPYFRDRTARDVDMGVAPLYFHGDNGDIDGARKTYTLIPPLLYFHKEKELDESQLTVVGPVISQSNPKRNIFDVAPLFFHITGKPETGGVVESHTTLFPLFHYGHSPTQNLFIVPGYLRRRTPTVDTIITPLFTHSTTRNNSTNLTMVGPIFPIYYRKTDVDIGYSATGVFPFFYNSSSPTHSTFAIPLFGRSESYNISRTYWIFPSIVYDRSITGWEVDIHPVVYLGREKKKEHTVLAPFFWDFASPKGRTTIGFPLYWRFTDTNDGTVTQITANTLYREKRAVGGTDWQFHLLPLFSYGQSPQGSWSNLLFGLLGYDADGPQTKIKFFWIPITVSDKTPAAPPTVERRPEKTEKTEKPEMKPDPKSDPKAAPPETSPSQGPMF